MLILHLVSLCWLLDITRAQSPSPSASFAYPLKLTNGVSSLTVNNIDTLVVQWTSNFDQAFLWFWCDLGSVQQPAWTHLGRDPVNSSGTMQFSPAKNSRLEKDSQRLYQCHFDLNYADIVNSNINGPSINVTSIAQQAGTYALQYTSTPQVSTGSTRAAATSSASVSLTSRATDQPSSQTSNSVTNSNFQDSDPRNDDKGISPGAIAGIAVGAVAGVLVLLTLGFMVWRNKRKVDNLQAMLAKPQGAEMAATSSPPRYENSRPKDTHAMELAPHEPPPQELHGSDVPVSELR